SAELDDCETVEVIVCASELTFSSAFETAETDEERLPIRSPTCFASDDRETRPLDISSMVAATSSTVAALASPACRSSAAVLVDCVAAASSSSLDAAMLSALPLTPLTDRATSSSDPAVVSAQ